VHVLVLVLVHALAAATAAAAAPVRPAVADTDVPDEWVPLADRDGQPREDGGVSVEVHALFTTLGLYRSDSDFDPTARQYDRDGQSEGQIATFLRPDLSLHALGGLTLFYQVELGWNAWSRNDPDAWFPAGEAYPVLKHREIWGEWRFTERTKLRTGYQHFRDPSGLFLNHWGGAAAFDVGFGPGATGLRVLAGQLPDSTYEGVDVRENNFVHDNVVAGVAAAWEFLPGAFLDAAGYYLGDFRVVDRPLHLGALVLGVRQEARTLSAWAHFVGQVGAWEGSAAGGGDQSILAWALQLGGRLRLGDWTFTGNALLLSPDDDRDGNDRLGAFFGPSKNRSRTLWLTEDEFRDRYDNLDERMSTGWGPFFLQRAGLFVADVSAAWRVAPWYQPALVLGAAAVLNPDNALGEGFVGVEVDWVNVFPLTDGVALFVVGQVFVPGGAAAAFVNDVDRGATRTVGGVEAGFTARF
jgi:hypothetical protein